MGSLNSHKYQQGKAKNTILKHRHLRMIVNLLRYAEFCVVLVLVSRLSTQLPVAIKNSSKYFQGFSVFMVTPCFVFLLGNVIIITLFAQSGQFSAKGSERDKPEPDIYQEFLQNSTMSWKNQKNQEDKTERSQTQTGITENNKQIQNVDGEWVKHPDKLNVRTENRAKGRRIERCPIQYREQQSMRPRSTNINSLEVKDYRRCHSDIVRHVESEKPRCALQRCESENKRGSIEHAGHERNAKTKTSYPEDGMSNEEFRRTIEAFIARQQKLRIQEQCFTA